MQAPQIIGGWGGFNILSSVLVLVVLLFLCHKVGDELEGSTRCARGGMQCGWSLIFALVPWC